MFARHIELYAIQRPSLEKNARHVHQSQYQSTERISDHLHGQYPEVPMSPVSDWVYSKKRPSGDQSVGSWTMYFPTAPQRASGLQACDTF